VQEYIVGHLLGDGFWQIPQVLFI